MKILSLPEQRFLQLSLLTFVTGTMVLVFIPSYRDRVPLSARGVGSRSLDPNQASLTELVTGLGLSPEEARLLTRIRAFRPLASRADLELIRGLSPRTRSALARKLPDRAPVAPPGKRSRPRKTVPGIAPARSG